VPENRLPIIPHDNDQEYFVRVPPPAVPACGPHSPQLDRSLAVDSHHSYVLAQPERPIIDHQGGRREASTYSVHPDLVRAPSTSSG
jgi:hypothetical protein